MKKKISILILLGFALGILGGIFLPNLMNNLSFLGIVYTNLLKFIIIPVIFTSIVTTIYRGTKNRSKIVLKTILTFVIMFTMSFLLTSLIVYLLGSGRNFVFDITKWNGEITNFNLQEIIINLFPTNLSLMIQNNSIFPCILFAFICGIASYKTKDGEVFINLMESTKSIFNKILEYIMYLTPIGVFSLIGSAIANYGTVILGVGAKYIAVAYLCSIIILITIMILPVWIISKVNPVTYIKKICKVWIVTLTTCSSAATLPYTIKICNEELKIPNKITDIVVPLGCTIHMCGGAVSFALLGIFTTQLFSIEINFITYILMLVSATLINMAAPGIPNGGIVIGATYLSMFNIPLSFMGLYAGIYKLLDMSYTTLNVTGDISANMIINTLENKKNKE